MDDIEYFRKKAIHWKPMWQLHRFCLWCHLSWIETPACYETRILFIQESNNWPENSNNLWRILTILMTSISLKMLSFHFLLLSWKRNAHHERVQPHNGSPKTPTTYSDYFPNRKYTGERYCCIALFSFILEYFFVSLCNFIGCTQWCLCGDEPITPTNHLFPNHPTLQQYAWKNSCYCSSTSVAQKWTQTTYEFLSKI